MQSFPKQKKKKRTKKKEPERPSILHSREEFMEIFGKNFIMEDHKHDGH